MHQQSVARDKNIFLLPSVINYFLHLFVNNNKHLTRAMDDIIFSVADYPKEVL